MILRSPLLIGAVNASANAENQWRRLVGLRERKSKAKGDRARIDGALGRPM